MANRAPKKYRDILSDSYDGPLYKYRSAVAKFDKGKELYNEYTERIITTQSLFYQDPRKFNDPFEFAPYVEPMSRQALKKMLASRGVPKSERPIAIDRHFKSTKQFQDHLRTNLN